MNEVADAGIDSFEWMHLLGNCEHGWVGDRIFTDGMRCHDN
jgi:hypothetical protein